MDRTVIGSLVILVGVILLLENIGPGVGIRNIGLARLWPLVLVAYGLATMFQAGAAVPDVSVGLLIAALGVAFLSRPCLASIFGPGWAAWSAPIGRWR